MEGVPSPRTTEAGGCFCGADIAASAAAAGKQMEFCSFSPPAQQAGGGEWDREG